MNTPIQSHSDLLLLSHVLNAELFSTSALLRFSASPLLRFSTSPLLRFFASALFLSFRYEAPVTIQIWDYDRWGSDDYVGSVRIPMSHAHVRTCAQASPNNEETYIERHDPRWYSVHKAELGDSEGEMLVSVELIDLGGDRLVPPQDVDIRPVTYPGFVEVIALGCRNLAPHVFQEIQFPQLKLDCGSEEKLSDLR